MISKILFVLCFVLLQRARAKYFNSSTEPWDSLNWTITAERQRQDNITLQALATEEDLRFPGATCNEAKEWTGITGLPGFVMQCECNLSSSTFVPEIMGCLPNSELKQGKDNFLRYMMDLRPSIN